MGTREMIIERHVGCSVTIPISPGRVRPVTRKALLPEIKVVRCKEVKLITGRLFWKCGTKIHVARDHHFKTSKRIFDPAQEFVYLRYSLLGITSCYVGLIVRTTAPAQMRIDDDKSSSAHLDFNRNGALVYVSRPVIADESARELARISVKNFDRTWPVPDRLPVAGVAWAARVWKV